MKQKKILAILGAFTILLSGVSFQIPKAQAQLSVMRNITFPVVGVVSYGDDFQDPRSGGARVHEGNDIMGKKMQLLVAAVDGTITKVNYPEATWGYSVTITDSEGYRYNYLHMNNDTPGTDDKKGDGFFAYAPDVQDGNPVVKGQLIGYMGDSGNAEGTSPHLHFEIRAPGSNDPLNPYFSLKAAPRIPAPTSPYPKLPKEILPYEQFTGGMTLATGNFDSDSAKELVSGAGPTGGPLVRTFEQDGTALNSFYAYDPGFRGGVSVASGDVDGDGKDEIITGAGPGGGPHLKILKSDGTLIKEFFAYEEAFRGGVNLAVADMNGDGKAEIITGAGAGGGPHVRVFNADGTQVVEFFAYAANFKGGVNVAATNKSNTQTPAIVTAPASSGGPHIKIFDARGGTLAEFFAYESTFTGGVRVAIGNVGQSSNPPEIMTIPASGGGPRLKTFGFTTIVNKDVFVGFEEWWRGGYVIASGDGKVFIGNTAGGRRASIRSYDFSQSSFEPRFPRNNNF
jgi:hypothetical protein